MKRSISILTAVGLFAAAPCVWAQTTLPAQEMRKEVYLLMNQAELSWLTLGSEQVGASLAEACFNIATLNGDLQRLPYFSEDTENRVALNEMISEMKSERLRDNVVSALCRGYKPTQFEAAKSAALQSMLNVKETASRVLRLLREAL
ncbi:MAG: hypothetical protein A2X94_07670 [Bdellovibrionales bacterium GWB1_55_8]|nr:MAG: hypothetical protein A2X94_07670 [Bdellovibrionales bacterium GWB1_55_8]